MTASDWRNVERLAAVLEAFTKIPPDARAGVASFLLRNHDRLADRSRDLSPVQPEPGPPTRPDGCRHEAP